MELRRFNAAGLAVFQRFLDSCTTDSPLPWPASALADPDFAETVDSAVMLEERSFVTRFELAEHLHRQFESADFRPQPGDVKMWAWIGCRYFQKICPRAKGGAWQPGSAARWIPETTDYRRYYRHLVAGPYNIYHAHREDPKRALSLLCQRPGRPGDVVEQLASRQQIVTNAAVIELATNCFVDPLSGQQRRSASSKGAGSARRFVDVLNQFDVTWDLSMLSTVDLRNMLPAEFGRNA